MKILTVGSINIDMVVKTQRLPETGETILSKSYHVIPGGKGANQAVAVSRMGAQSYLAGRVGDDVFGSMVLRNLKKEKVNVKHVLTDRKAPTGTAFITVDEKGDNTIVVAGGANMRCCREDVDGVEYLLKDTGMVLLQFEIPISTISSVVSMAEKYRVPVLLDPGPARKCPLSILRRVAFLSPNETETEALTGIRVSSLKTAKKAAQKLLEMGVRNVVMKLGANGALLASSKTGRHMEHIGGLKVRAVDSTAAGDAFTGAFAVAFLETGNIYRAAGYANYVGAMTVTKIGAQTSIPTRKQVDDFISTGHSARMVKWSYDKNRDVGILLP